MTPRQMQSEFLSQLQQFRRAPRIESEDIFMWLNRAQDTIVRGLYSGIMPNRLGRAFQQSQEVIDDLEKMFLQNVNKDAERVPEFAFGSAYKADRAPLPQDRLRIITARARIWYRRGGILDQESPSPSPDPTVRTINVLLRIVQSDDLYRTLSDPLATTYYKEPLAHQADEHLVIYTDDTFIVDKVSFSYLKRPQRIIRGLDPQDDQESELPEILHQEVVAFAVQMYLSGNQQQEPEVTQR